MLRQFFTTTPEDAMTPADDAATVIPDSTSRVERLIAHPLALAAALAVVYVVVCSAYIVYSDRLAAAVASSPDAYEQIQTYKGLAFIVLSGVLFFLFGAGVFQRLEQRRRQVLGQTEALIRAEGRAQAGILAASLAHDINNILTVINGQAELLVDQPDLPATARADVAQIQQTAGRLTRLVRFLAAMGKEQAPGEREDVDLADLLADIVTLARSHRSVRHRQLTCDTPDALPCRVNPRTVSRAVLNLVVNAAEATAMGGRIALGAAPADGTVTITVDDDGPGVPAEQREDIFREFHTSKSAGSGLGLMSVKYCAHEHQGDWSVGASPLGGARFVLELPLGLAPPEVSDVASSAR